MSQTEMAAPALSLRYRDPALPGASLPRLVAGNHRTLALDDHLREYGPLRLPADPAELIRTVTAAGLTGRGGAAFPTGRKLAAVRAANRPAVVVANGAEGEPASHKDKTLLSHAPHLVLDGLQLAAHACGAIAAVLYVPSTAGELNQRLRAAIVLRQSDGRDQLPVELIEAPPRFLAGQETAVVARIGGAAARPVYQQHRVFERGVRGLPTLVQNVETLAHLALIARHGPAWFRQVGTQDEPGSTLCTVIRSDRSSHVHEAALGSPLGQLLDLHDGVQAVLVGGYHGGWLSASAARQLRLSNTELRPAGASVGCGSLAALPAGRCGLAETASVLRYLALESAGQCGPCLNGLPRIAAAFAAIATPRPAATQLADLQRWSGLVTGRGACHHPDGTVRFTATALRVFAAEIAAHSRGRCTGSGGTSFLPIPVNPGTESDWR